MKFSAISFLMVAVLLISGCYTPPIQDWYPIILSVSVSDKSGNDLLDPENPQYIGDGAVLTYRGEEYQSSISTKAYLPNFSGLRIEKIGDRYRIIFGELDGDQDYNDDFVLKWHDGSSDIIHFTRKIHLHLFSTPTVTDTWKLNGSVVSNSEIKIIK